jgi:hypothetical protein
MSLRERMAGFTSQKTIDEMCRLAGTEIDRGGTLNVEVGKGADRKYLNINHDNLHDNLPVLLEILKNPDENGKFIRFTILNSEHQKTEGFTAEVRSRKQLL